MIADRERAALKPPLKGVGGLKEGEEGVGAFLEYNVQDCQFCIFHLYFFKAAEVLSAQAGQERLHLQGVFYHLAEGNR